MKKITSVVLCIIMVLSFIPVMGETIIVNTNKDITQKATAELYNGSTLISNEGYEADKMLDGDSSTFAYAKASGKSGHIVVVDLGAEYDISKLKIEFATPADVQDAIDTLSTPDKAFAANANDANTRSVIVLSNTKPAFADFSGYNFTLEGKTVQDGSACIKPGKTYTDGEIEDGRDYRYIGIYCPYSYGLAIAELTIWAEFSEEQEVTIINKIVSKGAKGETFHQTNLLNHSGYDGNKMTDGDSSTFGYAKASGASGHLAVVDLGDEYDITKLSIVFPTTAEVQTAIEALSLNANADNANLRSVIVLSNSKPVYSEFSGYDYNGVGKVIQDGSGSIKPGKTFEDIEDGNDYRYIGVYCPYSYGLAISELTVWADVKMAVLDPIPMHFSKYADLSGDPETQFGMGELYYSGRIVNDTDIDQEYTALIAGYKNGVLEYVEVENITAKANAYTDVSIPVIHKFRMDTIKGHLWRDNYSPVAEVSVATKKDNGYDPLFDGTILSMEPQLYDAADVLEEYNKTAETPVPLTCVSEFDDVDTIFFDGIKYQGRETKAFAYVAIPEGATEDNPVPGIVLVHGGGGTAYDRWAKAWADKGYAAIALNTVGMVTTETNTYDKPDRVKVTFGHQDNCGYKDYTSNESKHSDMWFYQALSDTILAGNVLRSYPQIDSENIGITGVSYGSVITMKVIGIDHRFKFAMPVYGGGYGWESPTYWQYNMTPERKAWDPIMFLKQSGDVPVLWFVSNRDQHFGLEQISKTYIDEEVFPKSNMIIMNNYSHQGDLGTIIDAPRTAHNGYYLTDETYYSWTTSMVGFANQHIDGSFTGLAKISRLDYNNGKITATVTLPKDAVAEEGRAKFKYVKVDEYKNLYLPVAGREDQATAWILQSDGVTLGTTASTNSPWPTVDAIVNGTEISVTVPSDATYGYIDYIDSRGIQVSSELLKLK